MDKASGNLVQRRLSEGLGLPEAGYAIFKDYVTALEYIRPCRELVEKGLFVLLGSYQCHVFLDWRFVNGNEWKAVYEFLNGTGVPSVQEKFDELFAVKAEIKSEKEEVKKKQTTRKQAVKKPSSKNATKKTAEKQKDKTSHGKKPASNSQPE